MERVLSGVKNTNKGLVGLTKLNEETLQNIAKEANGAYINGKNTGNVVESIRDILNKMDKKEFEAKQFSDFKDQFQWFIAFGIFFLFIDIFLLERKTEWLKKLNLFNENL